MTTSSTPSSALDALKALETAHENFVPPVVDRVQALKKQREELTAGLTRLPTIQAKQKEVVHREFDTKFAEHNTKADAERARLDKRISDRHDKIVADEEAALKGIEQRITDLREALFKDMEVVDEELAATAPLLPVQPPAGRQSSRRTNDKSTDVRPPGRVRRAARSVRQFVTVEEPPNNPQSASEPKGKK